MKPARVPRLGTPTVTDFWTPIGEEGGMGVGRFEKDLRVTRGFTFRFVWSWERVPRK